MDRWIIFFDYKGNQIDTILLNNIFNFSEGEIIVHKEDRYKVSSIVNNLDTKEVHIRAFKTLN